MKQNKFDPNVQVQGINDAETKKQKEGDKEYVEVNNEGEMKASDNLKNPLPLIEAIANPESDSGKLKNVQ
jgi:type IV secretory pathway VirJ component